MREEIRRLVGFLIGAGLLWVFVTSEAYEATADWFSQKASKSVTDVVTTTTSGPATTTTTHAQDP